jgi:flavin reductase (DIM6/NTAB) family NADH-FMN oxidoreductase RutF
MKKKKAEMRSCLQPVPKVLVSCRGMDGENNILAVGYCCNCSFDPPMVMVGIVPERYSYKMIKSTGCFVVNLVDRSYEETFHYMGTKSGRDGDKIAAMKVKLKEANSINAPLIEDCPVNIECLVVDSIRTGSHEMFVGKVECVHADERMLDETGKIDFSMIDFL